MGQWGMSRTLPLTVAAIAVATVLGHSAQPVETSDQIVLRGRPQRLHLYGTRGSADAVVVSSGDGGWIHLAPHVAEVLSARGFFVVGFDVRSYLESFTSAETTL